MEGWREGGGADGGIVKQERDNGGEPCFFGWKPLVRSRQEGGFLDEVSALSSVTTPSLLSTILPSISITPEPRFTISPSCNCYVFSFVCGYSSLSSIWAFLPHEPLHLSVWSYSIYLLPDTSQQCVSPSVFSFSYCLMSLLGLWHPTSDPLVYAEHINPLFKTAKTGENCGFVGNYVHIFWTSQ